MQMGHVGVGALAVDRGRLAELLHAVEVELPFFAEEPALQGEVGLGAPLGPGPVDARHIKTNAVLRVPANYHGGLDLAHELQKLRQKLTVPVELFAGRETLLTQVPALAVDF